MTFIDTVWRGCPFLPASLLFSILFIPRLILNHHLPCQAHAVAKVCAASPCSIPGQTVTQ